ncbi:MAG: dihydrofolate reductase [Thelocarpon superellum]|nr:MAG: dihydrofolate reductase [Thelocarpon superellum]
MAYFARVTKRAPMASQVNAVVMGRKTWESIPTNFRPLKGRLNVVVSRKPSDDVIGPQTGAASPPHNILVVAGLEEGLRQLGSRPELGRVFVIGGAEIYRAALELPQTVRVLLTKIKTDFDCDTFFPVDLGEDASRTGQWRRSSTEELKAWVGEADLDGTKKDGEVEFEFCMFERRDTP